MKLFCGIDWAEAHHDVAIMDGDGQLVAKKRITDDPTGFAELVDRCHKPGHLEHARSLGLTILRGVGSTLRQ